MLRFNLGKFNVKTREADTRLRIDATVSVGAEVSHRRVKSLKLRTATIECEARVNPRNARTVGEINSLLIFEATASVMKYTYAEPSPVRILFESEAFGAKLGESSITFTGMNLQPGKSFTIALCSLTAELDGRNAMPYIRGDSEFFTIEPGENTIEVTTTTKGAGTSGLKTSLEWRDRWL